jgi:hypothetical protein
VISRFLTPHCSERGIFNQRWFIKGPEADLVDRTKVSSKLFYRVYWRLELEEKLLCLYCEKLQ